MTRERIKYEDLKEWFLGNYFDMCRDRGTKLKWSRQKIISDIHSDFLSSFETPIEQFMVNIIALVLTSGWDPEKENYYRAKASAFLDGLAGTVYRDELTVEEKDELDRDLKVLGFDEKKDL